MYVSPRKLEERERECANVEVERRTLTCNTPSRGTNTAWETTTRAVPRGMNMKAYRNLMNLDAI